jgi:pyruvate/2-oxoglutarate dehydrogenase complex dihydrolipoamide dehydrogenase (E3) component
MSEALKFDAIVVGAGQAGPSLADRLARAGKRVAFVERHMFGGTCVNTGCTPTKSMVASAYAAHVARRAQDYGVVLTNEVSIDMKRVIARRDEIVQKSRKGVEEWLRSNDKITVFLGTAAFESSHVVRAGESRLTAPLIFLNVGGRAAVPQIQGVNDPDPSNRVPFLTNTSLLALDVVPKHLIVVGGSYVGLEFGQMYKRFGSEVTIVEREPRLVSHEDEDVSAAVEGILSREGIRIRTGANCIALRPHPDGVSVCVSCNHGDEPSIGSHVLMATGRIPNTDDLGLEKAGILKDAKGYIQVDDKLATNVPGIFALGDCNGKGAFTHTAYNDYEIVAENLLDGADRKVSDRIPCHAMFIDPPLARVGMTEAEVSASGRKALIATRPMTKVSRAREKGESLGFMKALVDANTEEILGASLLGVGCDEAIHSILDVMYAKSPFTTIKHAVHIHPTVAELIPTLLGDLKPLA